MQKSEPKASLETLDSSAENSELINAWCGNTKVVDPLGRPLRVFRGEHGHSSQLIHSRRGSISFASEEIAFGYATSPNDIGDTVASPRVLEAYLRILNPVISDNEDPFIDLSLIANILGVERAMDIAIKYDDRITETGNWQENFADQYESVKELLAADPDRINELYVDAYHVFDNEKYVQWFAEAGYDGAIHGGNGESSLEPEYKVFSKTQIKPISVRMLDAVLHNAQSYTAGSSSITNAASAISFLDDIGTRVHPSLSL